MKPLGSSLTQTYLLKENENLKYQVEELQEMLDYNKHALRESLKPDSLQTQQVLRMLYQENTLLRETLHKRHEHISDINSTMLIGEQIVMATESHEKNLIEELRTRLQDMKLDLKNKEKKILDLEKSRLVADITGTMHIKTLFVSTPSLTQVAYHDDLERINEKLRLKEEELAREKSKNEDLFGMNLVLNKQLVDMKSLSTEVKSGNSDKKMSDYEELLEYHQQMRNSDDSSSYAESEGEEQQETKPEKRKVPKLELTKAKEIQELIVNRINNKDKKPHQKKENDANSKEKALLERQLQEEKLKCLNHERKINRMSRVMEELQKRNELLVRARTEGLEQGLGLTECPSKEYLHQLQIRQMLEMARDVYLNDTLDRIINREMSVSHRDGALSA